MYVQDLELKGKKEELKSTYSFVGEGQPRCVGGWDGGIFKVGSLAFVAGVGSCKNSSSLDGKE